MKICLFDVSFNISVIEENQDVKLTFLQLWQYSFPHSDQIKQLAHTVSMLVHYHAESRTAT